MFSWKNLDWFLPRVEESHRKERMTEPPGHMCSPEPQRAWSPLSGTHSPPWRRAGWRFPPELCLNLIKWKNSSESPSCLLQRHRGSPFSKWEGLTEHCPSCRLIAVLLSSCHKTVGLRVGGGGALSCASQSHEEERKGSERRAWKSWWEQVPTGEWEGVGWAWLQRNVLG